MLDLTMASTYMPCAVHTGIMFWLVPLCRGFSYHSTAPLIQQPISQSALVIWWSDEQRFAARQQKPLATTMQNGFQDDAVLPQSRLSVAKLVVEPGCTQSELANQRNKTHWISKTMRHTCEIDNILALYLPKPGWGNCRPGHVKLKLG